MTIEEIEAMYAEFLPWTDPVVEGFEAKLSSVRRVLDEVKVAVTFELNGEAIGYVKYQFPDEGLPSATDLALGSVAGKGVLRRYADDSTEVIVSHIPIATTRATDSRVAHVYEQAGWTRASDDPESEDYDLWVLRPEDFVRTTES